MDSYTEWKVWRVLYPPVIYILINFMMQMFFAIIVYVSRFTGMGDKGYVSVDDSMNYMDRVNEVLNKNASTITIICAIIAIPVFYYIYNKDKEARKDDERFQAHKHIDKDSYAYIIVFSMALTLAVSRIIFLFPLDNRIGSYEETSKILFSGGVVAQIVSTCMMIPVLEELIFRGLVYNRIKEYWDIKKAVYISALLFGIYHMNLMQGVYAFVVGLAIAYIYNLYGSLAAPIVFHISANLLSVILHYSRIGRLITKYIIVDIIVIIAMSAISYFIFLKINNVVTDRNKS